MRRIDDPASQLFTPESRDVINRNYLRDRMGPHEYAFPGGRDLAGLPPVLIDRVSGW